MMRKTRRRLILILAPFVLLTCIGAWMYWQSWKLVRWIPGQYTAANLEGDHRTHVFRFFPDGGWYWEVDRPIRADIPTSGAGRWRLAGRVLINEEGETATMPVGALKAFKERFKEPIQAHET